jgi:hypothetical protein
MRSLCGVLLGMVVLTGAASGIEPWALYEDPGQRGDFRWMTEFRELAKPLTTNDVMTVQAEQGYIDLKGVFALPSLADGEAFRLRQGDANAARLHFTFATAAGDYHLAIDRAWNSTLALTKDGQRLVDDKSRWYAYRDGALDIRYVDRVLSVARGAQLLWSFPLAADPTNTLFEIEGRIQLFQRTHLPALTPAVDPYAVATLAAADTLDWKRSARDRYTPPEDGSKLEVHPNGSVSLSNPLGKGVCSAAAVYRPRGPCVMTVRVDDCSHASGVGFSVHERSQRTTYFAGKDDRFILCRDAFNAGDVEANEKRGFVYVAPFYLRTIYGVDFIEFEASQDGEHWSMYERVHLSQHYTMPLHYVELQLSGRTEGQAQHVRLSHVHLYQDILFDPQSDWIQQSNRTLLNGWGPASFKQNASIDFMTRLLEDSARSDDVLTLAQEAVPFMRPHRLGGQMRSVDVDAMMRWQGWNMIGTGNLDALEASLALWYDQAYESTRNRSTSDRYSPPALVRAALYQAWKARDWEALRVEALKYKWLTNPSRENMLADWMLDEAEARLDDVPQVEEGTSARLRHWPHPLRISPDRATVNLLGEMMGALEDNDPEQACKVLVRGSISQSLVSTEQDEDLYKPFGVVVKQILNTHPEMQQILIEKFNAVGMIRVGRASTAGDAAELERLADQFAGTEAARKALALLGDRDLSMGNFDGAVHRFESLIPHTEGPAQVQLRAKRNLALALSGHRPTDAITEDVQLVDRRFSAPEFASLLESCLVETDVGEQTEVVAITPVKGGARARVQPLMTNLYMNLEYPIASTQQGSLVALQQDQALQVIDLAKGAVVHAHGAPAEKRLTKVENFRPVFQGTRMLTVKRVEKQHELQCLNLPDFTTSWEHRFTEDITSDPVIMDGRLYVVTRSENELLYLHRLSWRTGNTEARTLLMRYPRPDRVAEIIRPQVVDGRLILPIRGSLMACDAWGELLWVRRLPYVPFNADPKLFQDTEHAQILPIGEERLILLAPSSPDVCCINVRDGQMVWRQFRPDRRFLLGAAEEDVLVRHQYAVEALNLADGSTRSRQPVIAEDTVFLHQAGQELILCRLDRPRVEDMEPKKRGHVAESWRPAPARYLQLGNGPRMEMESALSGFMHPQSVFAFNGNTFVLAAYYADEKDRTAQTGLAQLVIEP